MKYLEENGAAWKIITQYVSASKIKIMKCANLNKLLYQLIQCGMKMATSSASATVGCKFHKSTSRVSTRTQTSKVSKNYLKKIKQKTANCRIPLKHKCENTCEVKTPNGLLSSRNSIRKCLTTNDSTVRAKHLSNSGDKNKRTCNGKIVKLVQHRQRKVPIVYLTDVLSTQGRTTKENFMNYFALTKTESKSENIRTPTSTPSMVKLTQATNIPISSDLGRLIFERERHAVSNNYKARKTERCERYINRSSVKSDKCIEYPVTYNKQNERISTNTSCSSHKNVNPTDKVKKLYVILERLDLLSLQRRLKKNQRQGRLQKKCKDLKVIVKNIERMTVDSLLCKKLVR